MHIFRCCASANHKVVVPQSIPKPRPIVPNKRGLETLDIEEPTKETKETKETKKSKEERKIEESTKDKQTQENNTTEACCFCF